MLLHDISSRGRPELRSRGWQAVREASPAKPEVPSLRFELLAFRIRGIAESLRAHGWCESQESHQVRTAEIQLPSAFPRFPG